MTITTTICKVSYTYTGSGSATQFPYTFLCFQASDLTVQRINTDGSLTPLTYGPDYAMDGVNIITGGNIYLTVSLTNGQGVLLFRDPVAVQNTLLQQNASYNAAQVMASLDLLTMDVQALKDKAARSIHVPATEFPTDATNQLPPVANRANKTMAWDAGGTPIASAGYSNVPISAAMTPVVQASTLAAGRTAMGPWGDAVITATGGSASRTLSNIESDHYNVLDYGAIADGVTDSSSAFNAVSIAACATGGTIFIPKGQYFLNSQWSILPVNPVKVCIEAYGAEIFTQNTTNGQSALKIQGGYTPEGITVNGLKVNHRGNTHARAGFELIQTTHARLNSCTVEGHNTPSGYAAIRLAQSDPADGNTGCFWTVIDGLTVRRRAGADGTAADYGVLTLGACNATNIINSQFSATECISLQVNGTTTTIANGCLIQGNHFEGFTNAISCYGTVGGTGPTGLRIFGNRSESGTNFISLQTATLSAQDSPQIGFNYNVIGSVTNYITNPNALEVSVFEPTSNGIGKVSIVSGLDMTHTTVGNQVLTCGTGTGKTIYLGPKTGSATWQNGVIRLGSVHWLWVDASGRLRIKASSGVAPTSDTDGVIVGTQA